MGVLVKFLISFVTFFVFFGLTFSTTSRADHPIREFFALHQRTGILEAKDWEEVHQLVSTLIPGKDRVTPELQEIFYQIEEEFYPTLTPENQSQYQSLLAEFAGKFKNSDLAIQIPQKQIPFWIEGEDDFKKYRSAPTLPTTADIVVIGAGLTGSSAAYHLIDAAKSGKTVVVLESVHPASQSSGKNGGNFQLLPESYLGRSYHGLIEERLKWLRTQSPSLSDDTLRPQATQQAQTLVQFSFLNMNRIKKIMSAEKLDCDFSPNGWLRIASTKKEEKALLDEIPWLTNLGAKGIEILTPEQIQHETHIPAQYAGRLIRESGNYHPYKFVKEILKKALAENVFLYTGIEVNQISPARKGEVTIKTSEGQISAKRVIVATNAFTPRLFPELKGIECVPSQVVTLNHIQNHLQGRTITERYGDIYYNLPQSTHRTDSDGNPEGMLLYGLDFASPVSDPREMKPSPELLREQMQQIYRRFPEVEGQPPSCVWVGAMGFSADRVPSIGFLSEDVIIAAGFQGYGGSFCIEAGYNAAQMALTGETPAEVPAELFSPKRLLNRP